MRLTEREHEQRILADALARAVGGEGSAVWIQGEPGLGASALLRWTAAEARRLGVAVHEGSGGELEGDLPFGVARQALRDDVPAGRHGDRATVLHDLFRTLADRADDGPIAVLVDDAHWADDGSLHWLAFTARRIQELRAALVVASRPAVGHDLLAAASRASFVRLSLAPLTDAGVAVLAAQRLGTTVGPSLAAACGRLTAGSPRFADALLRAAAERDLLAAPDPEAELERLCPPAAEDFALQRLAEGGPAARALAVAVAVLGTAGLRQAADLAALDVAEAGGSADRLRRGHLFGPGAELSFSHPVVRTAVLSMLLPGERSRWHARAADLLRRDGVPAARVAAHLLYVEPADDPRVVEDLAEAAGAALRCGSPLEASSLLRRALAEPAPDAMRGHLHAALGRALLDVAPSEAIGPLTEASRTVDDAREAVELELELGRARFSARDARGAVAGLRAAIERHPAGAFRLEGEALGYELLATDADDDARRERLERMAAEAEGRGRDAWPVHVHLAIEQARTGTAARAITLARAAWRDGDAATSDWTASPLPVWLTYAFLYAGGLDEAAAVAVRWRDDARHAGAAIRQAYAYAVLSEVDMRGGDARAAEADASTAWEVAQDLGPEFAGWWLALAALVQARTVRGDLASAWSLLDAEGWADRPPPDMVQHPALREVRGALLAALGRLDEASTELTAAGRWIAARFDVGGGSHALTAASEVLVRLGRREEAGALAQEAHAAAVRFGAPIPIGVAQRAGALAGDPSDAVDGLLVAARTLAGSGARLEHARTLFELGAAMRRRRAAVEARAPLREALDIATSAGAGFLAEEVRHELVAAGARPRRPEATGPDALTAGELRVALLAAEGLSNPDIASRLFVTRKTVEKHLAGAFAKLGIASRRQLASALARRNGGEQE